MKKTVFFISSVFVATLFMALGLYNIYTTWYSASTIAFARLIQSTGSPDKEFFEKFSLTRDVEAVASLCTYDASRAALTISLAHLYTYLPKSMTEKERRENSRSFIRRESQDISGTGLIKSLNPTDVPKKMPETISPILDPSQFSQRVHEAGKLADIRLKCAPVDGNAWLVRGQVLTETLAAADARDTALKYSYWQAPAENWIMVPRFRLVSTRIEKGDDSLMPEFRADLARLVAEFRVQELAELYVVQGIRVQGLLASEITRMPERRKKSIADSVDALGFTIPGLIRRY